MNLQRLRKQFAERFELQDDGARALRGFLAFGIPALIAHALHRPGEAMFVSLTALNLSQPDLRGSYHVRVVILAALTLVASASVLLGTACADSMAAAVLVMGVLALMGGLWRHVSTDYGPAASISSAFLYLLGLSQHGGWAGGLHLAGLVATGGAMATLLHAVYWVVRPQHALRNAVAESWVATSDMIGAMRSGLLGGAAEAKADFDRRERDLRAALDRTFLILKEAHNPKQAVLLAHLEEMRLEVVQFSIHAVALSSALEPIVGRPGFARCLPAIDSVLKALGDASRSVALTLIMHRQEDFAVSSVRLRRSQHLMRAAAEQIAAVPSAGPDAAQVRATLERFDGLLAHTQTLVRETTRHSTRSLGFLPGLADMGTLPLKSLAGWVRPLSRPDPLLVRHAVRMAVFTMLAVALYKGFDIPHGYWIALTVMVVLQPDFGSTRKRAGARIGGTVAGSLLASGLLWIRTSLPVAEALAALMAFFFSYFLRRRYRIAVFFLTVYLVLVTETMASVSRDFMLVRVFCTVLGGGLSLVAAYLFWPVWEKENFTTLLSAAIRSNQQFLESLFDPAARPLLARRRAENANRTLAASLERMLGEPAAQREFPERSASLATYSQRMTRALTALALHPPSPHPAQESPLLPLAGGMASVIGDLALANDSGFNRSAMDGLGTRLCLLESELACYTPNASAGPGSGGSPDAFTLAALSKVLAEVRAMTLAMKMES